MNVTLHLRIAGAALLVLAASHVFFPKRFAWKQELARLSPLNRQIFLVHTAFIMLVLVMMGMLALFDTPALVQPTVLGKAVLAGITFFWIVRLLAQWLVYDRSLWVGNRFNTVVHVVFTFLWAYLVFAFGNATLLQWRV